MDYRRLGASGLKVPALTFGTATFGGKGDFFKAWGETDVGGARRLVDICLDAGVTMFDSADVYSRGESERVLGEAIKGRRDKVLISTKATFRLSDEPNDVGSSRFHLIRACEASLKRLGTDYIDLYQMHGFDAQTPAEETMSALDDLVRAGKIRYIGVSNFSGWHLMKALAVSDRYGYARFVANQTYYSLIGRHYEWELMPLGLDQGVGAVVWSPLGWGRLTGKVRRGAKLPEVSRLHKTAEQGPPVSDEHVYRAYLQGRRRDRRHRRRDRQVRAADRAQLAAAKADGLDRDHRRTRRETAQGQSRRGRLGADGGTGGQAR